jgi:hypothetical protein
MQHFPDEAWADFVRGVGGSGEAAEIQAHVAGGCEMCLAAHQIWDGLRIAGVNEMAYAPPEELIRQLKLQFTTQISASPAKAVLPVFDSFLQPLPVGFRSGSAMPRQVLYEQEGVTVDLRLEQAPKSRRVFATGQILSKRIPQTSLSKGIITLWSTQGLPLLETAPNPQGEFQFDFEVQENLHLSIAIRGCSPLRIALPQLDL